MPQIESRIYVYMQENISFQMHLTYGNAGDLLFPALKPCLSLKDTTTRTSYASRQMTQKMLTLL